MLLDALRRPRPRHRGRRGALALVVGIGLMGAVPSAGASVTSPRCAGADLPATTAPAATMRRAVVCLVNQQRAARGLPALRARARLDRSAQGWTSVMIDTATFGHGANFSARIDATGYFWSSAGENIATGFLTPREVVGAWMASPDHCHNILDPTFADVGTGLSTHPLGSYSPATWTQDFGLWMGHPSPSRNYEPQRGCPYRG